MEMNINTLTGDIWNTINRLKVSEGRYARTLTEGKAVNVNAYGCADAVNLMYTIDRMPKSSEEKEALADGICAFQDEKLGFFNEGSHVIEHGTAHCMGALEILDAQPIYPVTVFDKYNSPQAMREFLDSLDFIAQKGSGHYGAGVFCSLFLTKRLKPETKKAFFDWLNENVDRKYGMSKQGGIDAAIAPMWQHMGDWFHFLFCYYGAGEPFPYPERLIDTCIMMYEKKLLSAMFGRGQRFLEIDWIFSLNRAVMQCGWRFEESRRILSEFAVSYVDALNRVDKENDPHWNDMHTLFGAVCALSELQSAVPHIIRSDYPLRQVLDRRPFI